MRLLGLALLALLALPLSGAEVYRSLDENGNVVYSDRPEGDSPELVYVATPGAAQRSAPPPRTTTAAAAAAATPETPPEQPAAATRPVEPSAEQRAQNCAIARERAERYSVSHRLYRTLPDGEREYLNDSEIDEARAKAAADVDNWCS